MDGNNTRSLNGLLKLNLDNLYINNQLNTSLLSNNDFLTLSGIITTTTIQNQINDVNTIIQLLQNYNNG